MWPGDDSNSEDELVEHMVETFGNGDPWPQSFRGDMKET